jgi:hypothetical protein
MKSLTKRGAIEIIHRCAVEYEKNLVHKNLLFVTTQKEMVSFFEAAFLPRNFLHLTGVRTDIKSADFFDVAIRNRLSGRSIELPYDGTATLKLSVLPLLMNIHKTARMAGEYNHIKPLLVTDRLAGTVVAAIGFRKHGELYIPNTVLSADMRDLTEKPVNRVAAIFIKGKQEEKYGKVTYIAKGLTLESEILRPIVLAKTSLSARSVIPKTPLLTALEICKQEAAEYNTRHGNNARARDSDSELP